MKSRLSLLSRAFLLIVVLILLSLYASLSIFRHVQEKPRVQQMAQLVATVVNLTRAAVLSAAPEWRGALLEELAEAEGLEVQMAEASDVLEPLPDHPPELQMMAAQVRERLGAGTRFAAERNGVAAMWVSFFIGEEEFWIAVPSERMQHPLSHQLLMWGGVVLLLALIGAYLIARQVVRPLQRLALAAQVLGKGTVPQALPEDGAREIAAVSRAFNQMSNDLAANERERTLVLAGISHDLRTPLTRVRLAAEMSGDDSLRDGLIADVEQMDEVIQQFLDYARLDESEACVATDVSALVQEVVQRYASHVPQLEIQAGVHAELRPQLLKRALANLLDNAVKYGAGEIKISLKQDADHVLLSVEDNGTGIPAAQRDYAKRPFIRLQEARSDNSGAGLGLAIVERVAKMHGGELRLTESEMGGLLAMLVL
ncbi:MAG: ATP-binding protein [Gallionella sp.]|nr:ATP-binding protein [Gallionella sp.]